jgi:hypothetical protein
LLHIPDLKLRDDSSYSYVPILPKLNGTKAVQVTGIRQRLKLAAQPASPEGPMRTIVISRTNLPAGAPEDLRVFAERMAAVGAEVRLSPPSEGTTLPDLVVADGRPLSEIVVAARRGE